MDNHDIPNSRTPQTTEQTSLASDLELARAAASGSEPHWHAFVERYSGLLLAVIRRRLGRDEDEVRDVFVDLLVELRNGALANYEGRSTLSTWLIVVSQRRALDCLRARLGRSELPRCVAERPPVDQIAFDLFFEKGSSFEDTREQLRTRGHSLGALELNEILESIEDSLDPRTLRRLARSHTRPVLLDIETVEGSALPRIDSVLDRDEKAQAAARAKALHQAIEDLPETDRRVLELRYERELPAKEVARNLGLGSPRNVYTIAERAIRRLRKRLEGS